MPPKYSCLKKNEYSDSQGYQLLPLRSDDMENIRVWRNAQKEVLRQKEDIDEAAQLKYYIEKVIPAFSQKYPSQVLFSFLFGGDCIGYGGLTNIDWQAKRAEVSFLVDHSRATSPLYAKDHLHFLKLLGEAAFKDLGLHRLFTETFHFRDKHIQNLEKFGFKTEGRLREHVFKQGQWTDSIMHGLLASEYKHEE